MKRVVRFIGDQLRQRAELMPAGYTWPFMVIVVASTVLIMVASVLQRARADLPMAAAAALIGMAPLVLFLLAGIKFNPSLMWPACCSATVILLFATSTPIDGDVAPTLLVVTLGSTAALVTVLYGMLALGSAVALLAVASAAHRLDELALYLGMVAMGWLMGILTRMQAQLLIKQQEMQADLAEHAAADERRRIAREVHDVIAHSLSVTLLHVTGARRALQQDADVDDAVGALADAERLGRQAMTDIRRTVGLLDDGPSKMAPEPSIADIPCLVDDFASAGLPVTLQTTGHADEVSAAVGLALYRIVQESLANIAKHAPASKATVQLAVSRSSALLSIVNEMPVTVGAPTRDGRGLAGMRQRVELLGGVIDAGPCASGWSVRVDLPLTDASPRPRRCSR